jgi:hypothetical protein
MFDQVNQQALNSLAKILNALDHHSETNELMQRSLAILKMFRKNGHDHPKWKGYLEDYASILEDQGCSVEEVKAKILAL